MAGALPPGPTVPRGALQSGRRLGQRGPEPLALPSGPTGPRGEFIMGPSPLQAPEVQALGQAVQKRVDQALSGASDATAAAREADAIIDQAGRELAITVLPDEAREAARRIEDAGAVYKGTQELGDLFDGQTFHYYDVPVYGQPTPTTGGVFSNDLDKLPGMVAGTKAKFAASEMIRRTEESGGASFNLARNDFAAGDKGYIVSIAPERGKSIKTLTSEEIEKFATENADYLSDPRAYLGIEKTDKGYNLDISVITDSKADAVQLGRELGQERIYDSAAGRSIDVPRAAGPHPYVKAQEPLDERAVQAAREYDAALTDPAAKPAWDALARETDRLYDEIVASGLRIEKVTGQPYATADEMIEDINRGVLKVTTDNSEHPFWTVEQNFKFRVVHDYLGHREGGNDFSLGGEYKAFLRHAERLQDEAAKKALQTEVYGQAAAAVAHSQFQEQKAFLSGQDISLAPREQRLAGKPTSPFSRFRPTSQSVPISPEARAAYDQILRNTALLEDIRRMPRMAERLKQFLRDEQGAIGAKLPVTTDALRLARKGGAGAFWYQGVPAELQQAFGTEWERVADVIALSSMGLRPEKNVELALRAWFLYKAGRPAEEVLAVFDGGGKAGHNMKRLAEQVLFGGKTLDEAAGPDALKIRNFARALKGDENAVVVDRWMWRVFYPEEAARAKAQFEAKLRKSPDYDGGPARYREIEKWVRANASKIGITPAQFQAAMWVGKKIEDGNPTGIRPLREYIAEFLKADEAKRFFEGAKDLTESGRVNVGTIVVLARAALGGIAGSLTGDDPETATRNALLGMGLGSILSPSLARQIIRVAATKADVAEGVRGMAAVLRDQTGGFRPFERPPSPNVRRMGASPDAKRMVRSINQKLEDARRLARAYVVTNDETIAAALTSKFRSLEEVLQLDVAQLAPKDMAAARTAARGVRDFVLEDALETAARARTSGDPALMVEARQKYVLAGRVSQQVTDLETHIARAQQAGAIKSDASLASKFDLDTLAREVTETDAALVGTMTDEQVVKAMLDMGDRARAAKLAQTTTKYPQAFWNIYYGLNLLSSPVTHAKNITGNVVAAAFSVLDRAVAEGTEAVLLPFTAAGLRTQKVAFGETADLVRGMWEMVADSFRAGRKGALQYAGDTLRTGESTFEGATKAQERLTILASKRRASLTEGEALPKLIEVMNTAAQANLRFMDSVDEFFKVINFNGELRALARRQAMAEGLRGNAYARRVAELFDNPTREMLKNANEFAHEQTFTKAFDPNLGGWRSLWRLGHGMETLAKNPVARVTVAPFFRTPTRLLEYSTVHTPVLNALAPQFWSDLAAGGAKAELAFSKLAVGAGTMGLAAWYAAEGYVTGAWPEDPGLRKRYEEAGWQPYSVYLDGKYYSYAGLEPLSTFLGTVANYVQMAPHLPDHELQRVAVAMVLAASPAALNNPYATGISELGDVFKGMTSERSGTELLRWVNRRVANLIPGAALMRTVARASDPVKRDDVTVSGPPAMREASELVTVYMKQVPGWSKHRPPIRNMITGEPIPAESGWLGALLPYQVTTNPNDPVLNEIVALEGAGLPREVPRVLGGTRPRDSISVKAVNPREGVLLTDDERNELTRLLTKHGHPAYEGRTLHQELARLIESEEYKDASDGKDGGKALLIRRTFRAYLDQAEDAFLEKNREVATVIARRQLERDLGRLPSSMEDLKSPVRELVDQMAVQ